MPDPSTIAAIAGVAFVGKEVVKVGAKLVETAFAPAVTDWGEALAHRMAERRRRADEVMQNAGDLLEAAGIQPTAVPERLLVPLLQAASLEEDAELRRRWAALLANAADPSKSQHITPSFVSILKDLSPTEAKILALVYTQQTASMDLGHQEGPLLRIPGKDGTPDLEMPVPYGDFQALSDNLHRLGLVEFKFGGPTRSGASVFSKLYQGLPLTPLGRRFIAACTALSPTDSQKTPTS